MRKTMKVETYEKLMSKANAIRKLVKKPDITSGKLQTIQQKIDIIKSKKDTHGEMVTLNISTTVIEVDSDTALKLLQNALDSELRLSELYQWRMDKAISYLEGEYDDGFYNDK